ncbi:hypothetical protein GCM10027396_18860 [Insolitispirillum peregrinum]
MFDAHSQYDPLLSLLALNDPGSPLAFLITELIEMLKITADRECSYKVDVRVRQKQHRSHTPK